MSDTSLHALARQLAADGRLKIRWHDRLDRTPPPMPPGIDLADKVEGMLLGLAIGDALGNTTESMVPAERQATYGWIDDYRPNAHAGRRAIGLPSDDSQLAFRTLGHLLVDGRLDPPRLGDALAAGRIFGIGRATEQWLYARGDGRPWYTAGTPAAGNGALMRIAPVLLPHLAAPSPALWSDALLAAHLTHDDELSNLACVALVDLLWTALATPPAAPPPDWVGRALAVFDDLALGARYRPRAGRPPGFEGSIAQLVRQHLQPALAQPLTVPQADQLWHSGAYLLETVPSVLYILARHADDPRQALLQAVNHTRDNDTVAAIVGAAVGALHGASAWPARWIDGLSGRTGASDDGRMFALLLQAGQRFGHGSTPLLRDRAARAVREA